jgi:hypothetical protein
MFASFNKNAFPVVWVTMQGIIHHNKEFELFKKNWLSCYMSGEPFSFIFDTTNVGMVSIYYAYQMSNFIEDIKKRNFTTLKKSIIIAPNSYVRILLRMIFLLQTPVAPVFIVENKEVALQLYQQIELCNIKFDDFPNLPNATYIAAL